MKTKIALILVMLMSGLALAAPKDDIRARSEQRYPKILELKAAGQVGETSDGLIDAVKGADPDVASLITQENGDRQSLYKIIAKEQGISEAAVAQQAGARNFAKAKKGEWLRENGKWRQK